MKFEHEFKGARWSDDKGKWEVEILRLTDNEVNTAVTQAGFSSS